MIKPIVKNLIALRKSSKKFDRKTDKQVVIDLIDTAKAHIKNCVGLAAVQIGYYKDVFVILHGKTKFKPYINPRIITASSRTYVAKERCLSLKGVSTVTRHEWIKVVYTNRFGLRIRKKMKGFKAQVFQHEYDHLAGIVI